MYTLTLIAQKGGTGKTTLAINLSVAAGWGDHRNRDRPAVAAVPATRLEAALQAVRGHGADLAVIDTAPHSESAALAAARASDLALVPLRPGVLDLRALGATADICALGGARSAVVLNQAPPRGSLPDEAVTGRGLKVAPCRIGARVTFQHSLTNGLGVLEHEPRGKAAAEIAALRASARAEPLPRGVPERRASPSGPAKLVGARFPEAAPDPDKLRELTASIDAHGLLEPLIVSGSEEGAMVIGGGRRLAAMQKLVADGKWEPDRPVGCVLISNGIPADTAESPGLGRRNMELSLAENTGRETLHPVDQAEAFRVLREQEGATDKEPLGPLTLLRSRSSRILASKRSLCPGL